MIFRPAIIVLLLAGLCAAVPPAGSTAPRLNLHDLDGQPVDPQRLADRPTVLVFGELYHGPTRDAWAQIDQVLNEPRFASERITPVLIIAQDLPAQELKQQIKTLGVAGLVLHDPKRQAFGDYRVAVMPSVVVIDPQGKVVHSLPGMTARFTDVLRDALLVSAGRLSPERFEETLHPVATAELSEEQVRAERVTQLANQLARRGLDEMAQEQYAQALQLWPDHAAARMGLGRLLLKRDRIADAEVQFRALLEHDPEATEPALGLAFVHCRRGGDELAEAERIVRHVLEGDPAQPRAYYLLGLIQEQRDQSAEAAASFKRSAELLLERQVGTE